jgi:hypothetical protein
MGMSPQPPHGRTWDRLDRRRCNVIHDATSSRSRKASHRSRTGHPAAVSVQARRRSRAERRPYMDRGRVSSRSIQLLQVRSLSPQRSAAPEPRRGEARHGSGSLVGD